MSLRPYLLTACAALLLLPAGCGRKEATTPPVPETARGVIDTYLAIPSRERGPAEFANALQSLRELGPSGVPAIIELLAALSPGMAEEMCGLEWEEVAAERGLRAIATMGSEAVPGVLGRTRSDSDGVRAFAYLALSRMEPDGRGPGVREAVTRGVGDPHRGARNAAVWTLRRLGLPPAQALDTLKRACTTAPTGDTIALALRVMGELGLKDAVPFVRSVVRANHPEGDEEILAAAIATLAMLGDWEFEELMVTLAGGSRMRPNELEFYTSPGPVARWALARKAGYDYPRWGTGCDLAHVWWRLEGRHAHGSEAPRIAMKYGAPVKGLVTGIHADADEMVPLEWFPFTVAVKNVTNRPMRIMIGAPIGGGTGAFFRPVPEVLSNHGQVSWREESRISSPALVTVPPGGIAGVPVSFAPYGFTPALTPGDVVRLSVDYTYGGNPEDLKDAWSGTARSGNLVLTVRGPLRR
ncbi:MAG: HEAT repeat domain-containing protein [Planctomycetota bacterium]